MADVCMTCHGTGRVRTETWEGASIAERCDACHGACAPIVALRAIANGTKDNPIKPDPADELRRIDIIAMDAIARFGS